ncbi:hypothetical protein SDJN03_14327, partial [Cucurbita argyrosperma subsp. sororia]
MKSTTGCAISRSTKPPPNLVNLFDKAGGDKFRRNQGRREVLRRALMPPTRKPTLRWLNFRPTPSRLSNMSMAEA